MSLRTSLFIDLAGNLQTRANQFLHSMQRFGQGSTRSVQILNRTLAATGRGLDRLGNRYTALLSGAAGAGAVKQIGDLSQRLSYLGINAEVSSERIDKLYAKIMDVAQMPDIRIDPSEMLAGVEKITQKLGDLDLAEANLRNIGLAIRATGAAGEDVGDLIANFREKFNLKTPEEMLMALDILVKQGHAGAFELKDMVTQGNRITAAYGAMGRSGMDAVREMGAVMQVFKKSTGMPEEVATAWKNFFSDLMEPNKQKYLRALGINIWDPAKLKEGKKQIRSAVDIIGELLNKTKGDPEKLNRLFGMQALDGLKAFIAEYQKTGKNAAEEFMDISGDGAQLMKDSARAAKEFNAAMQGLYTAWQRFAHANLTGPIRSLADALNSLSPKTVDLWLKVGAGIIGTVGAAVLARKGWNVYQWGRDLFRGKGRPGAPGVGIPGIPGAGNVVPVYVVNMPGSMGGGIAPPVPTGPGGAAGRGAGWLKAIPWLALGKLGIAGGLGYAAGTGINYGINKITQAATGQDSLGAYIYDLLHKNQAAGAGSGGKTQVGGKISIEVQDKRIAVREVKSVNPLVDIDVSTGYLVMP